MPRFPIANPIKQNFPKQRADDSTTTKTRVRGKGTQPSESLKLLLLQGLAF